MKKTILIILALVLLYSCSEDTVIYPGVSQVAKDRGLKEVKVNQDANSSEICYFVKENGDSITIIGDKDENGCAKNIYLMKYNTSNEKLNTRFDDKMRPTSITYNNNVEIIFDWIDNNRAIVKAFDPETRIYITTEWDSNNKDSNTTKASELTRSSNISPRLGDLKLIIKERQLSSHPTRAISVDELSDQYCTFSVTQCDYPIDVYTSIGLMSAKPYKFIEILEYYKKISKGVYLYRIPSGSYPSKATNQELCQNIDNWILSPLQTGLTWLAGFSSVADVIALACASTGIGVPPAAILEALTVATVVGAGTLTVFMNANGTQGLMSTFNPDWYYKEYVISDLILSPCIITTEYIELEDKQINPETQDITISYDIDGDPTIDSFILEPDFPAKGQSYVATATFHCVPVGSEITMSIVGTDGYSNSKSVTVSTTSGIAELHVPGAATGVRDVCTVVINPPYGESITMTASLMFGF